MTSTPAPTATGPRRWVRYSARPIAREHSLPYDARPPATPEWAGPEVVSRARAEGTSEVRPPQPPPLSEEGWDDAGSGLRERVRALDRQARGLLDEATALADQAGGGASTGGELGALVDLAGVADTVHAAMLALTDRVEGELLAQRRFGLPLTDLLAMETRLTHAERRRLVRTAGSLARMPALQEAVNMGLVGAGEVVAVLNETRRLTADDRAEVDELFRDQAWLGRQTVDTVVDEVARLVVGLDDRNVDKDRVKAFERRFLAVTPGLDGTVAGYFELDDSGGALLLRALDDAAPPITSDRALTRDAALAEEEIEPDRRTLGRRRADGLVVMAEHWLAAHPDAAGHPDAAASPGGTAPARVRRARPLVYVWTDIATLTGDGPSAAAARLLWDTCAPSVVLTPAATARFASDARLQFILVDGSEVLGVAAPTPSIPRKVRAAVHARDQGCRFPGCRMPAVQTDLHHVIARQDGGHTTVDNLVCLCRRHHTAVTEARWILTMSPEGRVTMRRGRHVATSDPPVP